jgi:hypothetical protein
MKFIQYKDGSCDIKFSLRERVILFIKGKLHLSDESLKHFANNLVMIAITWQNNFKEEIKKKETFEHSKIESK